MVMLSHGECSLSRPGASSAGDVLNDGQLERGGGIHLLLVPPTENNQSPPVQGFMDRFKTGTVVRGVLVLVIAVSSARRPSLSCL